MRIRGCPSGFMSHRFDPITHRCRCGRWQAGFKPKTAPVRPRAECQVCERRQAVEGNGCLGHHGYKRPGCGWIQGDCFGVDHLPYPATDALVAYLGAVNGYLERTHAALAAAPELTELPFYWEEYVKDQYGQHRREKRTTMIVKGAPLPRCGNYCVPDFEDLYKRHVARLENEIRQAEQEVARVEKRIAAAKTLTGVTL